MAELFDAPKAPGGGKQTDAGDQTNRPGQLSDEAKAELSRNFSLKQQMHKAERSDPTALDLVGEAGYSAVYGGLQSPIISLGQVTDNLLGKANIKTNVAGFVDRMPAPEHEDFGTARWHAQQVGGGAGMILPFMATKGALSKSGLSFAARTEASVYASSRLISKANAGLIADGAIAGFAYDFLLRPVDKPDMDQFWAARGRHGLTGAATFGTLTAGSVGLRHVSRSLAASLVEAPKALRLTYDIGMGAIPGIPAGIVNADVGAKLTKGRWATSQERKEGAYTMAFAGGALSALHAIPGSEVPIGEVARAYSSRKAAASNLAEMQAERARVLREAAPEAKTTGTAGDGKARSATGEAALSRSSGTTGSDSKRLVADKLEPGRSMASADVEKVAQPTEVSLVVPKELVETLGRGVDLAFKASDADCTPKQVSDFFTFARGEGAPLKSAMLEVAKQYAAQDPHMMTLIREAYMPPEGIENRVVQSDIKLKTAGATTDQYQRWGQFMQTVREMPQDVEGYIRFRHDVFRWLNENKDLHDWALQYAQQNRYSKVAGPLDYYFGTSHLTRFFEAAEAGKTVAIPGSQTLGLVAENPASRTDPIRLDLTAEQAEQGRQGGPATPLIDRISESLRVNSAIPDLQTETAPQVQPLIAEPLRVNAAEPKPLGERTEAPRPAQPVSIEQLRVNDGTQPSRSPSPFLAKQRPGQFDIDTQMNGFETASGNRQRIDAMMLTNRFGEMSTEQFAKWLDYAYAQPKGATADSVVNVRSMQIMQRDALVHPDVIESYLRYRGRDVEPREGAREIPLEAIRKFLGAPAKTAREPMADWLNYYVEARLAQAEAHSAPDARPDQVLSNALPRWFVEQVKAEHVVEARLAGRRPTYAETLSPELVEALEAARRSKPPEKPKFGERPERPPLPNDITQRLERLKDLANIDDPVIRDRLLELGTQDHLLVRNIAQKLNPERSAPEYQELLRLVLPEATNIKDVKLLLDSIYFGNKANRADRGSEEAKANLQLAMATAEHLVPQTNENFQRVQDMVSDFITGKYRDPMPPRKDGGPGGGRDGGRGGREGGFSMRPPLTSTLEAGPQAWIKGPGQVGGRGSRSQAEAEASRVASEEQQATDLIAKHALELQQQEQIRIMRQAMELANHIARQRATELTVPAADITDTKLTRPSPFELPPAPTRYESSPAPSMVPRHRSRLF